MSTPKLFEAGTRQRKFDWGGGVRRYETRRMVLRFHQISSFREIQTTLYLFQSLLLSYQVRSMFF